MGDFVYCTQHLRVHSTGWCGVSPEDKLPLEAKDIADAIVEAKEKGYVYPDGRGALFNQVYRNGKMELVKDKYHYEKALERIRKHHEEKHGQKT